MQLPDPGRRSWIFPAIALSVLLRLALITFYAAVSGIPVSDVVVGHDGREYLDYARLLGRGEIAEIPWEARRHDVGYPAFLIPFATTPFPALASCAATLALLPAMIFLYDRMLAMAGTPAGQRALLASALTLVYPTQVYYSCFLLSEPLFLTLVLLGTTTALSGRSRSAFAAVGLATAVRTPGVLLAPALVVAEALVRRSVKTASGLGLWSILALVPWLAWAAATEIAWKENALSLVRPQMGFPFSGFAGMREVGTVRAVYVLGAVLFFFVSTVRLLRQAHLAGWNSPLPALGATFSAIFFLFHACITTVHYIDHAVWTFNYQDRYLVGLLPFALYAWRKELRPWHVAVGALFSVALSAWWGTNYFRAVLAGG